jgi:hypothetical protein
MNSFPFCNSSRFAGAGISDAKVVVREEARGLLAHHMWRVEICPNLMVFSDADSRLTSFTGKLSSMNRRSLVLS